MVLRKINLFKQKIYVQKAKFKNCIPTIYKWAIANTNPPNRYSFTEISGHVTYILRLLLPFPSPSEDVPNREMISAVRLVIYLNIIIHSF